MATVGRVRHAAGMGPDHLALSQLLALAGLVGATAQYSVLMRRRVLARVRAEQRVVQESGLQGLVRVFLADQA